MAGIEGRDAFVGNGRRAERGANAHRDTVRERYLQAQPEARGVDTRERGVGKREISQLTGSAVFASRDRNDAPSKKAESGWTLSTVFTAVVASVSGALVAGIAAWNFVVKPVVAFTTSAYTFTVEVINGIPYAVQYIGGAMAEKMGLLWLVPDPTGQTQFALIVLGGVTLTVYITGRLIKRRILRRRTVSREGNGNESAVDSTPERDAFDEPYWDNAGVPEG